MLKRLLPSLAAVSLLFALLTGCSQTPAPPATVPPADSAAHFKEYKEDMLGFLKSAGVAYTLDDTELSQMEGTAAEAFRVTLDTDGKADAVVLMTNPGNCERFAISLKINRKTLDECKLNARDYPWLIKMFNYVTDVRVSRFTCNSLMRSARREIGNGAEKQESFYLNKSKDYDKDDDKGLSLTYSVYYKTDINPAVYEETLSLTGYLSP